VPNTKLRTIRIINERKQREVMKLLEFKIKSENKKILYATIKYEKITFNWFKFSAKEIAREVFIERNNLPYAYISIHWADTGKSVNYGGAFARAVGAKFQEYFERKRN